MHQDSESSFRFNLRAPGVRALHRYLCLHLCGYLYLFLVLAICCSYLRLQVHLHVYTQRYIPYVKSICNALCMHMPPICAAHRIYIYIYTHTYVFVHTYNSACAHVYIYICTYLSLYMCIHIYTTIWNSYAHACIYVWYVCL